MVSFNILGDCVSRDIVTPLINKNQAIVLQYHAFSNPASLFSDKGTQEIKMEDITTTVDTNFRKRCAVHDINKTALDYVFAKSSDYIIVDFLDARLPMLKKNNHLITLSNCIRNCRNILDARFDMKSYTEISPFNDISAEMWEKTIIRICNIIKQHYSTEQVILNKHYGVENYLSDNNILPYTKYSSFIKSFNVLIAKLFEIAEKQLDGCHVIDFPNNVLGEGNHQWGLYPLHYHQLYYDFGAKALEIIIENHSLEKENQKLAELKENFEDKFELKNLQILQNNHLSQIDNLTKNLLDSSTQIKLLQQTHDALLSKHSELQKRLENTLSAQREQTKVFTNKLTKLDMQLKTEHELLTSLKNSKSFKIGRAITFIPRKIRDNFKKK